MKVSKIITYSISGLKRKKGRSILTFIGITTLIMTIVINTSLSEGFMAFYRNEVKALGTNWIKVYPGTYQYVEADY
jgi:hypothetical protein